MKSDASDKNTRSIHTVKTYGKSVHEPRKFTQNQGFALNSIDFGLVWA